MVTGVGRSEEERATGASSEFAPATMAELLAPLPAGARVLDLGCGQGSFAYDAFPNLAIDALDEASEPVGNAFSAHVHYRQGQAEHLPYPAGSFDLIIANFVMEHVSDFPRAIEEVARTLKAGGCFYLAVPNARSFEDALYRGLYDGGGLAAAGGHLQRHSFESVLATVYGRTEMKLTSYVEWPAGFTFLQDREGLRALSTQVVNACREALGIDIRAHSNYLFAFRKGQGLGRRVVTTVCGYCGSDRTASIVADHDWACPSCGRVNRAYPVEVATDERLETDMQVLWERHPHLRPPVAGATAPVTPTASAIEAASPSPPSVTDRASTEPPPGARMPEDDLVRRARLALRMLRRGRFER